MNICIAKWFWSIRLISIIFIESHERQVVFADGITIYGLGIDTPVKRQIVSTLHPITGTLTCFQTFQIAGNFTLHSI